LERRGEERRGEERRGEERRGEERRGEGREEEEVVLRWGMGNGWPIKVAAAWLAYLLLFFWVLILACEREEFLEPKLSVWRRVGGGVGCVSFSRY
jgi:hypothetical protein